MWPDQWLGKGKSRSSSPVKVECVCVGNLRFFDSSFGLKEVKAIKSAMIFVAFYFLAVCWYSLKEQKGGVEWSGGENNPINKVK